MNKKEFFVAVLFISSVLIWIVISRIMFGELNMFFYACQMTITTLLAHLILKKVKK